MNNCMMCKEQGVCKYKRKVLKMMKDMYPLKVECEFFTHFIGEPKQYFEGNKGKKRKFT